MSDNETFDEKTSTGSWQRLASLASRLGRKITEKVLVAYYVAVDPLTPTWARGSLLAALAYFGLPIDAIPDMTPFVGFTDDASVLAAALAAVATNIRWRHVRQARHAMRTWGMTADDPGEDADDEDTAFGFS